MTWRWVDVQIVRAVHERQLREHGGPSGIRDYNALESALARPRNLAAYAHPDAAALAASYCHGLARNHGFVDGNKRTAWVVARLFLLDNGRGLRFDSADAVHSVEALAAGTLPEQEMASWFRSRLME